MINIVAGTNFPKVTDVMIDNIIYENWKRTLPEFVPLTRFSGRTLG